MDNNNKIDDFVFKMGQNISKNTKNTVQTVYTSRVCRFILKVIVALSVIFLLYWSISLIFKTDYYKNYRVCMNRYRLYGAGMNPSFSIRHFCSCSTKEVLKLYDKNYDNIVLAKLHKKWYGGTSFIDRKISEIVYDCGGSNLTEIEEEKLEQLVHETIYHLK